MAYDACNLKNTEHLAYFDVKGLEQEKWVFRLRRYWYEDYRWECGSDDISSDNLAFRCAADLMRFTADSLQRGILRETKVESA